LPSDSLKVVKNYLENTIGEIGTEMYQKSVSKLNIGESPSKDEIEKLISVLEGMVIPLYGNNKAKGFSNELHKKLVELEKPEVKPEVPNNIEKEISTFLANNKLPNENDITDYAKYLALKYGGNVQEVEKDLIVKVKLHIKGGISKKKIKEEIINFLATCSEPTENDINDFINYLSLSKLSFQNNELRDQIEKERLYRKFHGRQDIEEISELDQFINFVKTSNDKEAIGKLMQKKGLSYLIKDGKGVSDKALLEFVSGLNKKE
jgi:hypothetical protein